MKKFDIHEWQAKQRLNEQAFDTGMDQPLDNVTQMRLKGMDASPKILDRIVSWAEHTFAEVLPDGKLSPLAIDELQKIIGNLDEIEVTGMEPDTGNMEKEFKVIGPKNQSNPLNDVEIEYKGQTYILDFEFGDVIDDHGNEGRDEWWEAEAEDGTTFMVDVYTPFPADEVDPEEVYWDTLEIEEPKEPIDEQNSLGAAGSGASVQPGKGMAHMPKKAWRRKNRKMKEALKAKIGKYTLGVSGGMMDKIDACITGNCE